VRVLAGGTEESRRRVADAWAAVTPWVGHPDAAAPGFVPLLADAVLGDWQALGAACGLQASVPDVSAYDGRAGRHAPWLAPLVEEMQSLARQHPSGVW
jgi:ring-1,2-phenylacetyl-CoA epoxidase subunit PaaC